MAHTAARALRLTEAAVWRAREDRYSAREAPPRDVDARPVRARRDAGRLVQRASHGAAAPGPRAEAAAGAGQLAQDPGAPVARKDTERVAAGRCNVDVSAVRADRDGRR